MRAFLFALCACASALSAALPAHADDTCHLIRIATVDMGIDEAGRLTVPMTVGGQDLTMLVDTGGIDTMLTDSVVKSQNLTKRRLNHVRVMMFGGTNVDSFAIAHDVVFGGLKAPTMNVLVVPDGRLPDGIGGLLAPDILRAYDDDFDFANAKFSLFSPDHCAADVVYWAKDYAQIDMQLDQTGHILVPVTLDGKEIKFTFDTGAGRSDLDWDLAKDLFGIDEHSPGVTAIARSDGKTVYKYAFKELTFGNPVTGAVTVHNPEITLTPSSVSRIRGGEVNLLGIGILRKLHLYIAYKERHLFVTPATAH
jgi:predicted aspartyl protease